MIKIALLEDVVRTVVPSVFTDDLSYNELLSRVLGKINELTDQSNVYFEQDINEKVTEIMDNWNTTGGLTDILRFDLIGGDSQESKGSLYVKNDNNFMGRKVDGQYVNIGTVQQNDVLQYGDQHVDTVWLVSNGYHSLRAPNSPSYQKIDSAGLPVGSGRTIKHQENSSYHLRVVANGDHVLPVGTYTDLHTLTNVLHVFPPTSYNNFAYVIPRDGMYSINLQLKVKTAPAGPCAIRVAISNLSGGVTTVTEMEDLHVNPSVYGTPFLNSSFKWKFAKDDQVTIKVQCLTTAITIENGTRLQIYQDGDTIQS